MSTYNVVPILDDRAWYTESLASLDMLFTRYITSDKSQSTILKDKVYSLAYTIQQHNNDHSTMESTINNDLTSLLSNYYNEIDINVGIAINNGDGSYTLRIYIDTVDNKNQRNSLFKAIQIEDSNIVKIFDINRNGVN